MEHKPDAIRAVVLIFVVGLVITGFTSLHASEEKQSANERVVASGAVLETGARGDNR